MTSSVTIYLSTSVCNLKIIHERNLWEINYILKYFVYVLLESNLIPDLQKYTKSTHGRTSASYLVS